MYPQQRYNKKEEIMQNHSIFYLSKKGLRDLKKSITKLEKRLASSKNELRDLDKGDSREDRLACIEKLSTIELLESELQEKIYMRDRAKQLPSKRDALKVALGSIVEMIDQQGRVVRYQIVDSFEADPTDGRISAASPLGRELIGRQLKDFIEWGRGHKTMRAQLVAIQ